VTLINSTISDNRAGGKGGGFRLDAGGTATVGNTIVAGNTSTNTSEEDVSGTIVSSGTNLIGNATGSSGWTASDLVDRDPVLGPLGNNGGMTLTHALLPSSPAINSGNNLLAVDPLTMSQLTADQRGKERFSGGSGRSSVDIGAYEASYSLLPVTVSGRSSLNSGRGIGRVRVTLDDSSGNVCVVHTNPFGYFRFVALTPGTTYTVRVSHKFFRFTTSMQVFTADRDRNDLNFLADP
jgi:hypothetical protein